MEREDRDAHSPFPAARWQHVVGAEARVARSMGLRRSKEEQKSVAGQRGDGGLGFPWRGVLGILGVLGVFRFYEGWDVGCRNSDGVVLVFREKYTLPLCHF